MRALFRSHPSIGLSFRASCISDERMGERTRGTRKANQLDTPRTSWLAKGTLIQRLRELVWVGGCVTTPATWASPPGRRCRSVHRSAKMASRCRFGAFVYTVATRVAIRICDASCARWHECLSHHGVPAAPPRWPLSLGREDRLCASVAAARLVSSPRRQPTRTPEEP